MIENKEDITLQLKRCIILSLLRQRRIEKDQLISGVEAESFES